MKILVSFLSVILSLPFCSELRSQSIQTSDIHGMVHLYGKKKYNTFSGTWKFNKETTWLLLNNGWGLKNPTRPPSEINFEQSQKEEPKRWIRWKEDKRFDEATLYAPSPNDTTYDMKVKLYSVSGTPASSATTTKTLILRKNRTFETSSFSLASIEGGNSSTYINVSKDKTGTTSTGSNTSTNGSVTTSSSRVSKSGGTGSMSGTYRIDGNQIELHFDDATVIKNIFATDGKEHIILGTNFYMK
ncbi:hypothetical protein FK220_005375 [Flavobacteriaceae bacterium TP-CH-4]|uniref:Uncharacterized protein n=1 Tax=Pelagihabitans pacificus TaxID=2696054 RepID=A0A967ASQ4_9FLAO|nr:hypothetical protein [Pelagihabitans pacificus]NHF58760.1 hypothetical protein [Pelagihabitans pacificus]